MKVFAILKLIELSVEDINIKQPMDKPINLFNIDKLKSINENITNVLKQRNKKLG